MAAKIWCQERPRHKLIFQSNRSESGSIYEQRHWKKEPGPAFGTDALGMPIITECNLTRDSVAAKNDNISRLCRVMYAITPQIRADIRLDKLAPNELETQAQNMMTFSDAMWREITQSGS